MEKSEKEKNISRSSVLSELMNQTTSGQFVNNMAASISDSKDKLADPNRSIANKTGVVAGDLFKGIGAVGGVIATPIEGGARGIVTGIGDFGRGLFGMEDSPTNGSVSSQATPSTPKVASPSTPPKATTPSIGTMPDAKTTGFPAPAEQNTKEAQAISDIQRQFESDQRIRDFRNQGLPKQGIASNGNEYSFRTMSAPVPKDETKRLQEVYAQRAMERSYANALEADALRRKTISDLESGKLTRRGRAEANATLASLGQMERDFSGNSLEERKLGLEQQYKLGMLDKGWFESLSQAQRQQAQTLLEQNKDSREERIFGPNLELAQANALTAQRKSLGGLQESPEWKPLPASDGSEGGFYRTVNGKLEIMNKLTEEEKAAQKKMMESKK